MGSLVPGSLTQEQFLKELEGIKALTPSSGGTSTPSSSGGGIGDFLSQVGTGFLTGAAQGFLGAAGGGQSASGGGSSQQDPYSAAAKAFLEKELKERMMMGNLASQATSAFS